MSVDGRAFVSCYDNYSYAQGKSERLLVSSSCAQMVGIAEKYLQVNAFKCTLTHTVKHINSVCADNSLACRAPLGLPRTPFLRQLLLLPRLIQKITARSISFDCLPLGCIQLVFIYASVIVTDAINKYSPAIVL